MDRGTQEFCVCRVGYGLEVNLKEGLGWHPVRGRIAVWKRTWDPLLKKAKLRGRCIHTLRQTFATHLLMAGVSPVYVARQLGHSRVTTTMNVYVHWIEEQGDAREVNRLDQVSG